MAACLSWIALSGSAFSSRVCLNSVAAVIYGVIRTNNAVHVDAPNVPGGGAAEPAFAHRHTGRTRGQHDVDGGARPCPSATIVREINAAPLRRP